ncbi:YfcC family protein [Atopococcus tabaci]|uniref:YfcC family protein n=1 Tax=Atopococcus tabaci TaxID=269774 RepID=UPI000481350A|nr:YfcC family protein [Atopococcus tabaci]
MENVLSKFPRKFSMPHTYVLLFGIMALMALLTWVVPAGEFERVMIDGRTVVVPGSYQIIESNPQGWFDLLKALPNGFAEVQNIAFFLFLTGGSFALINETGMIEGVIGKIVRLLQGKEAIVIPVVMLMLAIGGATIGLAEETIVFVALGVALARALGYDAMVGTAMIALGAAIGFYAGFMNPFSVGVAQEIAELPLFSGVGLRLVLFFSLWIVTSWYIIRYAKKVKRNPENSLVYELEKEERANGAHEDITEKTADFTKRHALISAVFVGGFILIAFGVFQYGWFITEIGAVFFAMGLLSALISGMNPNQIAESFVKGAQEMVFAALIVGLARGILVVMENGLILDTLVYALTNLIGQLPDALAVIGMYLTQIVINFFIPSGSGQAAATMPVMIPLADSLGITRQTAVLAYQMGDGFLDSIIPTSGVLMAQLSLAKISYGKWAKFLMPLIIIWLLIGMAFLLFANWMNYGPF